MNQKLKQGLANPRKIPPYLRIKLGLKVTEFLRGGTTTLEIGDETVEFGVGNKTEFRILRKVPERKVIGEFISELGEDDIVWDVGANIGLYTCFACAAGAEVVAIEPDRNVRLRLEENAALNEFTPRILPIGLGEEQKELELDLNIGFESGKTTVETVRGDHLVNSGRAPSPTVVKIDIEGFELEALRGLSETLESVRTVYVELHPERLAERGESADDVRELLSSQGYNLTSVVGAGNEIVRGAR